MKKSYRKVPKFINQKLEEIGDTYFEVGSIKRFTADELEKGALRRLNIDLAAIQSAEVIETIPPKTNGLASKRNIEGHVFVRRDLPKYQKPFFFDVPVWGDWSKGSNTITQYRMVYPRDPFLPPLHVMQVSILNIEKGDQTAYILKFKLKTQFLMEETGNYYLLHALNLLQENIGTCDVFSLNASDETYLRQEYLNWEIFPAGEMEEAFKGILAGNKKTQSYMKDRIEERLEVMKSLNPIAYIKSANGLGNYFGAQITEDLVVFENAYFGNAIYILQENWKTLSKLSRTELLKDHTGKFIRIPHVGDWKGEVHRQVSNILDF